MLHGGSVRCAHTIGVTSDTSCAVSYTADAELEVRATASIIMSKELVSLFFIAC